MNKERRKALSNIADRLCPLRDELAELQAEEQEYFDNMPVGFQQSERGQKAETAAEALSDALDSIDEILGYIEDAIE